MRNVEGNHDWKFRVNIIWLMAPRKRALRFNCSAVPMGEAARAEIHAALPSQQFDTTIVAVEAPWPLQKHQGDYRGIYAFVVNCRAYGNMH